MSNIQKAINALLIVGLIVVGLATIGSKNLAGSFVEKYPVRFVNGIFAGDESNNTRVIDSTGKWLGAFNGTSIDASGASDISTLTQGGGITATSTTGATVPLVAANFDRESVIAVTLNVQDATLSFPASSTLSAIVPNAGDFRSIFVRNATTTATMDLTMTGGTGVIMKYASSTSGTIGGIVHGDTDGDNYAKIDLIRKTNTDIDALVTLYND